MARFTTGKGRPRKTTPREDHSIRQIVMRAILRLKDTAISSSTVSRRLAGKKIELNNIQNLYSALYNL